MEAFSRILSLATQGRQVLDQTGLTGGYNMDLQFTPEALSAAALAARAGGPPPLAAADRPQWPPSLFTALQEQTGAEARREEGLARGDGAGIVIEPPTGLKKIGRPLGSSL